MKLINKYDMFYFNLITAWRNLKKNMLVSGINILGLTIGLTCAVFAIIWPSDHIAAKTENIAI